MTSIGEQRRSLEVVGEELFTEGDRLILIHLAQAVRLPGFLGSLHDEGRGLVIELVDVRLEPAVLGTPEVEREGIVQAMGAQPDVAIGPRDAVRLEDFFVTLADAGIDAVARDDQVRVRILVVGLHFGLEHQLHVQRLAAGLQDVQQLLAADADESMPPRADTAPLEQQLDVIPVIEGFLDFFGGFTIPLAHVVHGDVGEHHPPAERVVGPVTLHHRHIVAGIELLHEQGQIQACGTTPNAYDLHLALPPDPGPWATRHHPRLIYL
ncbi:hypothetical protein CDEF62S_01524 [Castellaniella defragrans]